VNNGTFVNNHISGPFFKSYGGVAYLEGRLEPYFDLKVGISTFTARNSTFRENSAYSGGVAYLNYASTFTATDSFFIANEARYSCGVACIFTSLFEARNSTFLENSAGSTAGVASLKIGSKFSARNSSFINNRANESDAFWMSTSSTLELFNGSFTTRPNVAAARHYVGDGTIYMALMRDLDLSMPLFDMNGAELFLYLTNDDGSPDNDLARIADGRGTVNVFHWTYPCGAGRFSVDGMEHSETILDISGNSIDDNVSFF